MIDQNEAIKDWLLQCPQIQSDMLFFNYLKGEDGTFGLATTANSSYLARYIDGSILVGYQFAVIKFVSMSGEPVAYTLEDIKEMNAVQEIVSWANLQGRLRNFPQIVDNLEDIESLEAMTQNPTLAGVDSSSGTALAKYMFEILIKYIIKENNNAY